MRIAVLEDDPDQSALLSLWLQGQGHKCNTFQTASAFQRSFHLPDYVDGDKISGNFENGVITVTLPKTPEAQKKTRKIEIKTGGK